MPPKFHDNRPLVTSPKDLKSVSRSLNARPCIKAGEVLLGICVLLLAGCEPPAMTPNGVIGIIGELGLAPGQFSYPRAIAAEPDSSIFVVDKDGRVQRFDRDGAFETVWRMPQCAKGKPVGLTVHPDGRLFVADTHYSRVLVFDRTGTMLASFGSEGFGDGEFQLPTDVAVDAQGFIYVGEYNGNDRITKWSPELKFLKVLSPELIEGSPLNRPAGLVVDNEQTLWVADACNHRMIRFSLEGEVLDTFGGFGEAPGELSYPYDVSLAPDGTLLVCEYGGSRLQWFSTEGQSLGVWGKAGRAPGELFSPWGATYGPDGRIYVVDSLNNRVQIVRP